MTGTELIAIVRRYIGNPSTTAEADATLLELVNFAYKQIATRYQFHATVEHDTINTAAGTRSYALDSDDVVLLDVWNRTYQTKLRKIDMLNVSQFDDTNIASPQRGRPTHYYRSGANVILYPNPDAVYVLELVTRITPASIVAGTSPAIPLSWHEGIALWARWQYFDQRGDYPKAQYAYNVLQTWLSTKENEWSEENAAFQGGIEMPTLAARHLFARSEDFTR